MSNDPGIRVCTSRSSSSSGESSIDSGSSCMMGELGDWGLVGVVGAELRSELGVCAGDEDPDGKPGDVEADGGERLGNSLPFPLPSSTEGTFSSSGGRVSCSCLNACASLGWPTSPFSDSSGAITLTRSFCSSCACAGNPGDTASSSESSESTNVPPLPPPGLIAPQPPLPLLKLLTPLSVLELVALVALSPLDALKPLAARPAVPNR